METATLEFEFRLTEQEYVAGVRKVTFSIRGFMLLYLIAAAMIIFQITAYIEKGAFSMPSPLVIIFVVMGAVLPSIINRSARKQYHANSRVCEQLKYHVSKDLIQIKAETYNCDLPLKKIVKTKETKDLILIYETKQQAHIVPKRALTESELATFKEIIN